MGAKLGREGDGKAEIADAPQHRSGAGEGGEVVADDIGGDHEQAAVGVRAQPAEPFQVGVVAGVGPTEDAVVGAPQRVVLGEAIALGGGHDGAQLSGANPVADRGRAGRGEVEGDAGSVIVPALNCPALAKTLVLDSGGHGCLPFRVRWGAFGDGREGAADAGFRSAALLPVEARR
ncbi:hypothetical protein ACW2Q0_20865 [Nocardia sp. R16R-3T]